MAATHYEDALRRVKSLSRNEQERLVTEVNRALTATEEPVSLMTLEGLGAEIWRDVDVDEYLNRERSSWDG